VPHMGSKKLKLMVRKHARHGTMESFVGEFESRLDRFIYRCNMVTSIFAARQMIGHGHVMVNGKTIRRHSRKLQPHDIVEPTPAALTTVKRLMRNRLKNNIFLYMKPDASPKRAMTERKQPDRKQGAKVRYDTDRLRQGLAEEEQSYRRLARPLNGSDDEPSAYGKALSGGIAVAEPLSAEATYALNALLPNLIASLSVGSPLADELGRLKHELSVVAPPLPLNATAGAPPPMTLVWRAADGSGRSAALLEVDRVAVRRLLLGVLALQSNAIASPRSP